MSSFRFRSALSGAITSSLSKAVVSALSGALPLAVAALVGAGSGPAALAQDAPPADDHVHAEGHEPGHGAAAKQAPSGQADASDQADQDDVIILEDADPADGPGVRRYQFFRDAFGGDDGPTALAFAGPRARLGVTIELTDDGLKVQEVESDSLAAAAGVVAGDLLLRVGKTRIQTTADVAAALAGRQPGDEVTVAVVREGSGLVELTGSLPARAETRSEPRSQPGSGLLGVNLDEQDGQVRVAGVVEQSGAWFAGLARGDVLVELDGTAVATPEDVVSLVGERAAGDFVALGIERDGARLDLRARLGARNTGERLLRFVSPNGMGGGSMGFGGGGQLHRVPGNRAFGAQVPGWPGGKNRQLLQPKGNALGEIHTWFEQLHEDAADAGGEIHETRVEIRDGVMTIERDGKLETYQLEELESLPIPRLRQAPAADDGQPGDTGFDIKPQDV